jgi:uncharacterized membrane protein YkvA (DUF1232 family)
MRNARQCGGGLVKYPGWAPKMLASAWIMERGEHSVRTDRIRKQIRQAWDDEARSGAFAALIRQQLERAAASAGDDNSTVGDILDSWRAQLELVPDLFHNLRDAAEEAGIADRVDPVLAMAQDYFLDPDDVLPDRHGVLGLLDDMYLALSVIHAVSEAQRTHVGQPLMDADLSDLIEAVRPLFTGQRLAALDERIEQSLAHPELARSIQQLADAGCMLCVRERRAA